MKRLIFISVVLIAPYISDAQAPQFAVVRPDGTTYICPTWDSVYNKAVNGDNIYLPGVTINSIIYIDKRLNIYGAGHHPDSSNATGKTTINSNLMFLSGSSGGSIEGIQVTGNGYLQYSGRRIRDLTIKRCRFNSFLYFTNGTTPSDSLPTNITLTENLLNSLDANGSSGNSISKNIIKAGLGYNSGTSFSNNIFAYGSSLNNNSSFTYCVFQDNIFLITIPLNSSCTNTFSNNLKLAGMPLLDGCPPNTGTETNTISVPAIGDIFINYDPSGNGYPYLDNYHLKPTCPGINAGTDGTDVGIYGTSSPTSQGWVPSNPHIYFKQVAPQTNTNGQLQIQFKVRTNN